MSIAVVGSMNMDLIVETDKFPRKGETVSGKGFNQKPGGKGLNQALTAARLGGEVSFIGACGRDDYGDILIDRLSSNKINVKGVSRLDLNTGIALVTVEGDGDNRIIIIAGANGEVKPAVIDRFEAVIKRADYVLLQLEIPLETVLYTVEVAAGYQTKVILDPAPARELPRSLFASLDYFLPNEIELDYLLDCYGFSDREKGIEQLLRWGLKNLIVTRGERGVTLYTQGESLNFPVDRVKVIDTTGAGDAFAGGLVYGLERGWTKDGAIKLANRVAALTVSYLGAQAPLAALNELKKEYAVGS